MIAHIDHGKISLTSAILRIATEMERTMNPDTATILRTAANKTGLAEAAADNLSGWLKDNGWEITQIQPAVVEKGVLRTGDADKKKK